MPKIFIRQMLNVQTRQSIREVVDGQQRLRTILSYLKDGFSINPKHNSKYGGYYFSQLDQVDEEIQGNILNYEVSTDLLVNMPDSEVLDIFGRLNSYSVTLNDQEKINANHFGPFKTLADNLAHEFHDFWTTSKILSDSEVLRMGDVTLTADLLIAMSEGIKSKKQIKSYYSQYEREYNHDPETLYAQFSEVINVIQRIFGANFKETEFTRIHVFYSLFTAIFHLQFGLIGIDKPIRQINRQHYARIANKLDLVNSIFSTEEPIQLSEDEAQFLEDSRRATTDTTVRTRRTEFLIDLILQ